MKLVVLVFTCCVDDHHVHPSNSFYLKLLPVAWQLYETSLIWRLFGHVQTRLASLQREVSYRSCQLTLAVLTFLPHAVVSVLKLWGFPLRPHQGSQLPQ